jgi:alanine racemase
MEIEIQNRPTWAEIDLDKLASNFRSVKKFIGEGIKLMGVVKADAYGHGAVKCSQRLEKEGIDWFGVALPTEGLELRKEGITRPILCLGSFWEGQENLLLKNHLTPVIYQLEQAERLNRAAQERGLQAEVHIKIDSGMGRIGVRYDEVSEFAEQLKKFENIGVEGLMTHFAVADDLKENEFTNLQIKRYKQCLGVLKNKGFNPIYQDLANSAAGVGHPASYGNMVRLGGILYGLGYDVLPSGIKLPDLKPVLSLFSRIAHIKTVPEGETIGYGRTFRTNKRSRIATIPIGYQDGFSRNFSNRGKVLIKGEVAPIVGRISMDWTIIDVTGIRGVCNGDKVTLIGKDGDREILAEHLAELNSTISYEITCGINRRVEKIYVESK